MRVRITYRLTGSRKRWLCIVIGGVGFACGPRPPAATEAVPFRADYAITCGGPSPDDTTSGEGFVTKYPALMPPGHPANRHAFDQRLTIVRMRVLHEFISRYYCERHQLPDRLEELRTLPPPADVPAEFRRPASDFLVDAWGQAFEYILSAPVYRIRSKGPDGHVGTVDDLETSGRAEGPPT